MPNLASFYDGTETLDLGNGCNCVLRRYLSERDFRTAGNQLLSGKRYSAGNLVGTQVTATIDTAAYNVSLMKSALISWNLTDDREQPLPLTEKNVEALPNIVFRMILDKVNELNKEPTAEDTAKAETEFRTGGDDGAEISERDGDST